MKILNILLVLFVFFNHVETEPQTAIPSSPSDITKAFFTFGGPTMNYKIRVKELCAQAQKLKFFDRIFCYTEEDLHKDISFWSQHGESIQRNHDHGYGFWIWKPYMIGKILESLQYDDVLVYMDAGCMFNPNGKNRLQDYLNILRSNDKGLISFQLTHKEAKFTKSALF